MRMTVSETARKKGLREYNTTLPENWIKRARELCAIEPIGNIVWCYERKNWSSFLGAPTAITEDGEILLSILASSI